MTETAEGAVRADPLAAARDWLKRDGRIAMATVVDTWGSSPVPVGGQMAVAADGQFQGSVSGGCIEGEIITEAADVLADGRPRAMTFGVSDERAWSAGLPCGGQVRVLLERLEGATGADQVGRLLEARERRRGLVIAKRLADARVDLYELDQPGLPDEVAKRFRTAKSGLVQGPEGEVFYQAAVPPARILAIGATHITQVLAELARLAGYEIHVIDPRTAFADPARFPGVTLHAEWPQDALPRIGLDPFTVVAVLAHVEHIDDEALKLAVRSDARFIGALGSGRNHARRTERLKAAGLGDAEIGRIKNPIGLDIGAQSPAEIAVAVMAEIIEAVRGRKRPSVG